MRYLQVDSTLVPRPWVHMLDGIRAAKHIDPMLRQIADSMDIYRNLAITKPTDSGSQKMRLGLGRGAGVFSPSARDLIMPEILVAGREPQNPTRTAGADAKNPFYQSLVRIDRQTYHILYGEGSDQIDVSEAAKNLGSLIAFIEKFHGKHDVLRVIHHGLTGRPVSGNLLDMSAYMIEAAAKMAWGSLRSRVGQSGYRVNLSNSTYLEFKRLDSTSAVAKRFFGGRAKLQVTVNFFGRSILLNYDRHGNLLYTKGQMGHLSSIDYPVSVRPDMTSIKLVEKNVGDIPMTLTHLNVDGTGVDDLAQKLFLELVYRKKRHSISYYDNVELLPIPMTDYLFYANLLGIPPEDLGIKTCTNYKSFFVGQSEIEIDELEHHELFVDSGMASLDAPTHTIWQEIDRLNRLMQMTKKITYHVTKADDETQIYLFVYNDSDQEWQYYSHIHYDRFGVRSVPKDDKDAVKQRSDLFHDPSQNLSLKKVLESHGLTNTHYYFHDRIKEDWLRDKQLQDMDHYFETHLVEFFDLLARDAAGFFNGIHGKDIFNWDGDEMLDLAYVAFHVTHERVRAINEYFFETGLSVERSEILRRFILEGFSYSSVLKSRSGHSDQQVRDRLDETAKIFVLAQANRVHQRHLSLKPKPKRGRINHDELKPFTIIFDFREGIGVVPGGRPQGGQNKKRQTILRKSGIIAPPAF